MRRMVPARLDPVGRLRLPRRTTTLRAGLVALLLLTAAGVLYAGESGPSAESESPAGSESAAGSDGRYPGVPAGSPPAGPDPHADDPEARLPIPTGMVGVPVPLADPTSLAVLRPGDQVDLFAVPTAGGDPVSLAERAPVLAVDRAGAALLLALTPEQGRAVVTTPTSTSFAVIVR